MRRYFLSLGLAAISLQPVAAQPAAPTAPAERLRPAYAGDTSRQVAEPAGPLTLAAALDLALRANAELAAAAHEVEAVEAAVIHAGLLPNPEVSASVEDTRRHTRTTTFQLNRPIEPCAEFSSAP